jgi:hypothetical protein
MRMGSYLNVGHSVDQRRGRSTSAIAKAGPRILDVGFSTALSSARGAEARGPLVILEERTRAQDLGELTLRLTKLRLHLRFVPLRLPQRSARRGEPLTSRDRR